MTQVGFRIKARQPNAVNPKIVIDGEKAFQDIKDKKKKTKIKITTYGIPIEVPPIEYSDRIADIMPKEGDQMKIELKGPIFITFRSNFLDEPIHPSADDLNFLVSSLSGEIDFRFRNNPNKAKHFTIGVFPTRFEEMNIAIPNYFEGPAHYVGAGGWGSTEKYFGSRRFTHEARKSGMVWTGTRMILLSSEWFKKAAQILSPFHDPDDFFNKPDIGTVNERYLNQLVADCIHSLRNGIVPIIDLLDQVGLKYPRAHNHVFNRNQNSNNNIIDKYQYVGLDDRTEFHNIIERVLKHGHKNEVDERIRTFYRYIMDYISKVMNALPSGVVFSTGNELDSRTVERILVEKMALEAEFTKHKICINGDYLWGNHYDRNNIMRGPDYSRTIDEFNPDIKNDSMMPFVSYLRMHHCKAEPSEFDSDQSTVERMYEYIWPVLEANPHIKIIFDNDGVGSGQIRGSNGRPAFYQVAKAIELAREVAEDRYGGFFVKTLSIEDTVKCYKHINVPNY